MKIKSLVGVALLWGWMWSGVGIALADVDGASPAVDETVEETTNVPVSDPLEPWNRLMFSFNDTLYDWVLKPVAQGYSAIVPEGGRLAVQSFFRHIATPVRLANDLLQGKVEEMGVELARFGINTVMGGLGFFDAAAVHFDLKSQDEDFGQTLGAYGVGDQLYLVWPLFGPSNLRDTVGMVGDFFVDPLTYYPYEWKPDLEVKAVKHINYVSLHMSDYEEFREKSLDPYVAMRDAYLQLRREQLQR